MRKLKLYFILFVGLIIVINLSILSCNKEESPTEPVTEPDPVLIFEEDFESYSVSDTSGWTIHNSHAHYISDITCSEGSKSLRIGKCDLDNGIYKTDTGYKGDAKLYFSIRTPESTGIPCEIYYMGAKLRIQGDYIYTYDSGGPHGIPVNSETWYDCKVEIDWDTSKYKLYLGGSAYETREFTKSSGSGWGADFSITGLVNVVPDYSSYIDDIRIYKVKVEL